VTEWAESVPRLIMSRQCALVALGAPSIVRMWRFSKSNGMTEGFHTKMEMLSRRAYGFRNFENDRLRALALCGWEGVMHRV